MASKIQVAVRVCEANRIVLPWRFVQLNHTSYTYQQLWADIIQGVHGQLDFVDLKCKRTSYEFQKATAFLSLSLTNGIEGDAQNDLMEVVNFFNMRFFSINIKHGDIDCDDCRLHAGTANPPTTNAFQVMMAAAKEAAIIGIPKVCPDPKCNLDKLKNTILTYFQEKMCIFPANCGKAATVFVARLSDFVYYLDGQYFKIEMEISKAKKFPEVFKRKFSGFNCPEKSKHRKRELNNLSEKKLESHAIAIREVIQSLQFLDSIPWAEVKQEVLQMVQVVEQYCLHLRVDNVRNKVSRETPRSEVEIRANVTLMKVNKSPIHPALSGLDKQLLDVQLYSPISIREFLPTCDRRRVYEIIQELKQKGLKFKCIHYAHQPGGSKQALHFVWRVDEAKSEGETIERCLQVIKKIEAEIPVYERRITKKHFMQAFGFVVKPVALRAIFRELKGDQSAPANLSERELDSRFQYAMQCEDAGILVDLRNQSPEKKKDTFKEFFSETERYLAEDIGVACHERRHGEQLYLAKAVSIKDLHERIKERVPPGTNVPSVKWLRYQFQPINPRANTAKYYKGIINVKMMVQKRQVM